MKIKPIHPNFTPPYRATPGSGGYDLFMPEGGSILHNSHEGAFVPLGFAAAVPKGYVALILPRSGKGSKEGLSLNNTVGVIDSDYRGEWIACLRVKNHKVLIWNPGDKLLQFILVPVHTPELELVTELTSTDRGEGGFGSTGI